MLGAWRPLSVSGWELAYSILVLKSTSENVQSTYKYRNYFKMWSNSLNVKGLKTKILQFFSSYLLSVSFLNWAFRLKHPLCQNVVIQNKTEVNSISKWRPCWRFTLCEKHKTFVQNRWQTQWMTQVSKLFWNRNISDRSGVKIKTIILLRYDKWPRIIITLFSTQFFKLKNHHVLSSPTLLSAPLAGSSSASVLAPLVGHTNGATSVSVVP